MEEVGQVYPPRLHLLYMDGPAVRILKPFESCRVTREGVCISPTYRTAIGVGVLVCAAVSASAQPLENVNYFPDSIAEKDDHVVRLNGGWSRLLAQRITALAPADVVIVMARRHGGRENECAPPGCTLAARRSRHSTSKACIR